MKASEIKEWACGNGIPCHGELIETVVNGEKFRAEFYATAEFGAAPELCLAADSFIEKEVNGEWESVKFHETGEDEESFTVLVAVIQTSLEQAR